MNNFQLDSNKRYYAEFRGDATYKPSKVRIYPVPTPIYKETHFITLVHNNHIGFKLHDGRDNTLWDMPVEAYLNGTQKGTFTTSNNWTWLHLNSFTENDEVKLIFDGDGDYNNCEAKITLTAPIMENNTTIKVNKKYSTEKDKPITITAQLLNHNNEPMSDFPLKFYHRKGIIEDVYLETVYTDKDGFASITWTPSTETNPQHIRIVFEGNPSYDRTSELVQVKVGAGYETHLIGELENTTYKCMDNITVQLLDENNEPLSNKEVHLCSHTSNINTQTGEDIGSDTCFNNSFTDDDGYATLTLNHKAGTFTLSATFNGDEEYKKSRLILGEITLNKRNLCMITYPGRDGTLHAGTSINTRVYDCTTDEGINGAEVTYYFIRQSTGASEELKPITTNTNNLGQDGYAYRIITYSDGIYFVGVTVTDPSGRYNSKSTVYSDITNKTLWDNNQYLHPIKVTSEGKIQTQISLSNDTIVSGENMVATLLDESGNPLPNKTVWFADENKNRFATATTDQFGHAKKQFNMAEQKNKMMYYGWDSDNILYDSCESVNIVNITRRSICFNNNNLGPEQTINIGFEYINQIIDCRTSEPLPDKWVAIVFERFKKDTNESLGRSSPYYLKSDKNGYLQTTEGNPLKINLAPSGSSGEYHYTYELYYYHDLNDTQEGFQFEQHDGYYNDKKSSPIKFYTKVNKDIPTPPITITANPVEVWTGKSYILQAELPSDATGTVLFKLSSGAYLNKNEPAEVIDGVASWTGIDTAQPGQTFYITAEFTSKDYLKYNDSTDSNTITINTVTGENKSTQLTMQNYAIKGGNDTSTTDYVYATLKTVDGVGISGEDVNVNIAGTFYPMTDDGDGRYKRVIQWTGLKQGRMYATYSGKENQYEATNSDYYNLISYKNRVGYGNLWILYPDTLKKGEELELYLCDSNMDPISGFPVTITITRSGYSNTDTTTVPSDAVGNITGNALSYSWNNVTIHCKVTFNSNTGYISYGENKGYIYDLPKGFSVEFDLTYTNS